VDRLFRHPQGVRRPCWSLASCIDIASRTIHFKGFDRMGLRAIEKPLKGMGGLPSTPNWEHKGFASRMAHELSRVRNRHCLKM